MPVSYSLLHRNGRQWPNGNPRSVHHDGVTAHHQAQGRRSFQGSPSRAVTEGGQPPPEARAVTVAELEQMCRASGAIK
jgi:hypothetical protein